jgi:hypothetical protein
VQCLPVPALPSAICAFTTHLGCKVVHGVHRLHPCEWLLQLQHMPGRSTMWLNCLDPAYPSPIASVPTSTNSPWRCIRLADTLLQDIFAVCWWTVTTDVEVLCVLLCAVFS